MQENAFVYILYCLIDRKFYNDIDLFAEWGSSAQLLALGGSVCQGCLQSKMVVVNRGLTSPSVVTYFSNGSSGPSHSDRFFAIAFVFVKWCWRKKTFFKEIGWRICRRGSVITQMRFCMKKILAYCCLKLGLMKIKFYKASELPLSQLADPGIVL